MKFFAIAALIAAASALKVKSAIVDPNVEGQRVTLSSPVAMELPIKGKATI